MTSRASLCVVALAALSVPLGAVATDIEGSCLVSFNIDPSKTVFVGQSLISCGDVEAKRADLFRTVNGFPDDGSISTAQLSAELKSWSDTLANYENQSDWVDIGINMTSNSLASYGLVACGKLGAGCALAVVGKIFSVYGLIKSAADSAAKHAALDKTIAEIRDAKTRLDASTPDWVKVRQRAVDDFTALCQQERSSCLAH
jgi:hypothetical protein